MCTSPRSPAPSDCWGLRSLSNTSDELGSYQNSLSTASLKREVSRRERKNTVELDLGELVRQDLNLTECELILLSDINQLQLHTADQDIPTEQQETYQPANLQGICEFLQFCLSDQGGIWGPNYCCRTDTGNGVTSVLDNWQKVLDSVEKFARIC